VCVCVCVTLCVSVMVFGSETTLVKLTRMETWTNFTFLDPMRREGAANAASAGPDGAEDGPDEALVEAPNQVMKVKNRNLCCKYCVHSGVVSMVCDLIVVQSCW
jgi:hypothetical protein